MSAAEVLVLHRKSWTVQSGVATCTAPGCGWGKFGTLTQTDEPFVAHQLDALKAAGYEVVERLIPDGLTVCWMAYYSDLSGVAVFDTEIEALRHAIGYSMQVIELQAGDVNDQITAKIRGNQGASVGTEDRR